MNDDTTPVRTLHLGLELRQIARGFPRHVVWHVLEQEVDAGRVRRVGGRYLLAPGFAAQLGELSWIRPQGLTHAEDALSSPRRRPMRVRTEPLPSP